MTENKTFNFPFSIETPPFSIGYNSHGYWTTFGDIYEQELDRENYPFTEMTRDIVEKYKDCPAIWVTKKPMDAFRYNVSADEFELPLEEIEKEYPNWKNEIFQINCERLKIIVETDDGDGGILLVNMEGLQ